jgi:hypothetical protein
MFDMKRWLSKLARLLPVLLLAWLVGPALAQIPKELRTKPGVAVAVVNLVNPRADCSINPGPVALPSLKQRPANGTMLMQIIIADVAASGNCPARKIPTIAIAYAPKKDFTGEDALELEIDVDNRTTLLAYRIIVAAQAQAQPL